MKNTTHGSPSPDRLLRIGAAARLLGIHPQTLRVWTSTGRVVAERLPAHGDRPGERRYSESALRALLAGTSDTPVEQSAVPHTALLYARVSGSSGQESSLDAQEAALRVAADAQGWPVALVVRERASGLNEQRRGLQRLLAAVVAEARPVVLVTHADRLTRFGFSYLEQIITAHGGSIRVVNAPATMTPEQELVEDLLSLVSSFAGRAYGQRSAAHRQRLLARLHQEEATTAATARTAPAGRTPDVLEGEAQ